MYRGYNHSLGVWIFQWTFVSVTGQGDYQSGSPYSFGSYGPHYPSAFRTHPSMNHSPYSAVKNDLESTYHPESQYGSPDYYNPNYTSLSQPTFGSASVYSQGSSAFNVVPSNQPFSGLPYSGSGRQSVSQRINKKYVLLSVWGLILIQKLTKKITKS